MSESAKRTHAMSLAPGDRFRCEPEGTEYQLKKVGKIYMAVPVGVPDAPPQTLTSIMGRHGLMVLVTRSGGLHL